MHKNFLYKSNGVMTFVFILVFFLISIVISQIMGRKSVFYVRFFTFLAINLISFAVIIIFFDIKYVFIGGLLYLSLIMAWSGFAIHISNSIVLALLNLISKANKISKKELLEAYDIEKKFDARIKALISGRYLVFQNNQIAFNRNRKNNTILNIIIFLTKT